MDDTTTGWVAAERDRLAPRAAKQITWEGTPVEDLVDLHPDDVLVLGTMRHRLGNVTFDKETESGRITRAAAYSRTVGRWIDLKAGTIRLVEGDRGPEDPAPWSVGRDE